MSETAAVAAHAHAAHGEHEEVGFIRHYVFSTDHKMIARQFLFLGLFMMIIGGLLALMVRWELAWPESQVPLTNWIPIGPNFGLRRFGWLDLSIRRIGLGTRAPSSWAAGSAWSAWPGYWLDLT